MQWPQARMFRTCLRSIFIFVIFNVSGFSPPAFSALFHSRHPWHGEPQARQPKKAINYCTEFWIYNCSESSKSAYRFPPRRQEIRNRWHMELFFLEEAWPDDLFLLSAANSRIVFSHETALYFHGLMERSLPASTFLSRMVTTPPICSRGESASIR